MKINSVQTNQNVTFGYDKKLNKKVRAELLSNPTSYNIKLLKLNDLCNEIEDELVSKKVVEPKSKYARELVSMLVDLKNLLTSRLMPIIPNYQEIETEHYLKRASLNNPFDWRSNLAASLELSIDYDDSDFDSCYGHTSELFDNPDFAAGMRVPLDEEKIKADAQKYKGKDIVSCPEYLRNIRYPN